jgi:hypothetical protein
LNATHQLLVFADDVNILGESINKNTDIMLEASSKAGLEVNTKKIKYIVMSSHQNVGQNHNLLIANTCKYSENVAEFKYLGITVTNQNYIQKQIKDRLNIGNACYHSDQNLLFPVTSLKTWRLKHTKL